MSDCSKHKKEVAGVSDMSELARQIGDLHYATLAEFLNRLSEKLHADYVKDMEAGRIELSKCLLWAHYGIYKASHGIERAWKISQPFMNPSTPHQ
jgi:hypothetical protein